MSNQLSEFDYRVLMKGLRCLLSQPNSSQNVVQEREDVIRLLRKMEEWK